jgi:formylglycine-generating enzyme required for sulfatase activity
MVVVPAGRFMMGSPPGEKMRGAESLHPIDIPKPFAVAKYELTFDLWDACVRDGGCRSYQPADEGWGRGKRPVINVDWVDAHAYVEWLSRKSGQKYRLLSEAEWEYAGRAGASTPFAFGPTLSSAQANFDASSRTALNPEGEAQSKTVPVGSFQQNAFGLYDMHGNVWEWTDDCWRDEYAAGDTKEAVVTTPCTGRVLRGGSWEDSVSDLRAAARVASAHEERSWSDGIRLARDLP